MMTAASCPKPDSGGLVNSYSMRAMEFFHFFSINGPGRQLHMLFLYFSREKTTFSPSLPDFTSNNIQPEQTYISH